MKELKEREQRFIQLQEEVKQNKMRRSDSTQDTPRQEVRLAQQEASKASAPPPPPPPKRSRDEITPKEAPTNCPKTENQGLKATPTFKLPPSSKAKIMATPPPPPIPKSYPVKEELKEEKPPPPSVPHPEDAQKDLDRRILEAKQKEARDAKAKGRENKARRERENQEDRKGKEEIPPEPKAPPPILSQREQEEGKKIL